MTIYDDMRGYVHTHDRNGWFDVIAETTPMYQMIDKADAENAKLRALVESYGMIANEAVCDYYDRDEMLADANATASELGIEVGA